MAKTIATLFRRARGDFHDEPAQLVHRKSILERRLDHAEEAASRRGGLGINAAVALRKILREIQDEARVQLDATKIDQPEFDRLSARAEAIRQKLSRAEDIRAKKLRVRKAERERLFANAKPPFPVPPGFRWLYDVIDARVEWWLVVPPTARIHIKRAQKEKPNAT